MTSCRQRLLIVAGALLLLALASCSPKRVLRQPEPETPVSGASRPTTDPVTNPDETPAEVPPRNLADEVLLGVEVATLAREQVGRPYRWGGTDPGGGFDCSGLVQWSYGCVGVNLPRVVRELKNEGRAVDGDKLQLGDLVFFAINGDRVSHVGIYLGGRSFVHAPSSGSLVRENSLDDPYWRGCWKGSRRVVVN